MKNYHPEYRYNGKSYLYDHDFGAAILPFMYYNETGKLPPDNLFNEYQGWMPGAFPKQLYNKGREIIMQRYIHGYPIINSKVRKILDAELTRPSMGKDTIRYIYNVIRKVNASSGANEAPKLPKAVENYAKWASIPGAALFSAAMSTGINAIAGPAAGIAAAPIIYGASQQFLQNGLDKHHPDDHIKVPDLMQKVVEIKKNEEKIAADPNFSVADAQRGALAYTIGKYAGSSVAKSLENKKPTYVHPSATASGYTAVPIGPAHTRFIYNRGGNRTFFNNGRHSSYNNTNFNRGYNRRFRRYGYKNYRSNFKKYRRYRNFHRYY